MRIFRVQVSFLPLFPFLTSLDLEVLSLPMFDMDDQPTHPNYLIRQATDTYESSSISLVTLPSLGVLYLSDGSCEVKDELTLLSSIPRSPQGKYFVKYRPAANQHSKRSLLLTFLLFTVLSDTDIFDTFRIRGIDGITGQSSLEIANISLIVKVR